MLNYCVASCNMAIYIYTQTFATKNIEFKATFSKEWEITLPWNILRQSNSQSVIRDSPWTHRSPGIWIIKVFTLTNNSSMNIPSGLFCITCLRAPSPCADNADASLSPFFFQRAQIKWRNALVWFLYHWLLPTLRVWIIYGDAAHESWGTNFPQVVQIKECQYSLNAKQ